MSVILAHRRQALLCLLAVIVLSAACGRPSGRPLPEPREADVLRVASFDFPESEIVTELYARSLRRAGIDVEVLSGFGTREILAPALQQGQVDLVVDYSGSLLDYLGGSPTETHGTADQVAAALRRRLGALGLTSLAHAPAEDANAFAVRADFARRNQLSRLSDLRALAPRLTFGGPPECPLRRYCLRGLQETYGLRFAAFRPQPSRGTTATALESGEIDVGLLETTYGRLGQGRLTVLHDDLGLQPRENLVPVVRSEVLRRYGDRLSRPLDAVSGRLSTDDLLRLNYIAIVNPVGPAAAVEAYVRRFGF